MDLSPIREFETFAAKQIDPAIIDLKELPDDSRKHIQRLLFTNLVDQFDVMVDRLLLQNCREDALAEKALSKATGNVTEGDLIRLLMNGDKLEEALATKLKDEIRNSTLSKRHSLKLKELLATLFEDQSLHTQMPRVNVNTGQIVDKFKIANKKMPHSVTGFADWLYCRRNAIVHGGTSVKISPVDLKRIKEIYKVDIAKSPKISLGSSTTALNFYRNLTGLLR